MHAYMGVGGGVSIYKFIWMSLKPGAYELQTLPSPPHYEERV